MRSVQFLSAENFPEWIPALRYETQFVLFLSVENISFLLRF